MMPRGAEIIDVEVENDKKDIYLIAIIDESLELSPRVIIIYSVGYPITASRKNIKYIGKGSLEFNFMTSLNFYIFEQMKQSITIRAADAH